MNTSKQRILSRSQAVRLLRGLLPLAIITFVTLIPLRLVGYERIAKIVIESGAWAPVIYVFIKIITFVIAPLSGVPVKIVGGTVFGFWNGITYSLIGDAIAGSINFIIARKWGWQVLNMLIGGESVERVYDFTVHSGTWRKLLFARLFLAYDYVSYAAGLTQLSYPVFLVITVVGGIVPTTLYVWIGNTERYESQWVTVGYSLLGIAILCGSVVVWFISKKEKQERAQQTEL